MALHCRHGTWLVIGLLCGSSVAWPAIFPSLLVSRQDNTTSVNPARALNFIPVPVSEECLSDDGRRNGLCLNTYECRLQNGVSHGPCALGFGVCCVFTGSCDAVVNNNVTYFVNPDFPGLSNAATECTIRVSKIFPEISQLRLDFEHFSIGQPNRRTGVCEVDAFIVSGGSSKELRICGQNHGQHIYYDVETVNEPITMTMKLTRANLNRMWEIKVTQIEFQQRAPAGCMQYYREPKGVIQTMNFADNGRHLADQDYNICLRQGSGMCSVVYEPCDENSFKLGPSKQGPFKQRPNRQPVRPNSPSLLPDFPDPPPEPRQAPGTDGETGSGGGSDILSDLMAEYTDEGDEGAPAADVGAAPADDVGGAAGDVGGPVGEGGGPLGDAGSLVGDAGGSAGPGGGSLGDGGGPGGGLGGGPGSLNPGSLGPGSSNPGSLGPGSSNPALLGDESVGPGYIGGDEARDCEDRIVMPCDNEEFIMADSSGPGVCDLHHCGSSFCTAGESPCRIESSTAPFNIRVLFGPGTRDESPDDNLGMCLNYEQQPCAP